MKVLLVDDHKIIRDGLRAVLEGSPDLEVAGEAADGHEALVLARAVRPEVVVMDVSMPGLNGIDATARLTSEHPGIKVLGLSMSSDRRYVLAMLSAGASGYLLKDAASDELLRAIRTVASGQTYLSPQISAAIVETALKHAPRRRRRPRARSPRASARCSSCSRRGARRRTSPSRSRSASRRSTRTGARS